MTPPRPDPLAQTRDAFRPLGDDPGALRQRLDAMQAALEAQQRQLEQLAGAAAAVQLRADGVLVINAARVEMNAATVTFNAAMVQASGVVRCDTIVATTVVGASYTPGAGNIW